MSTQGWEVGLPQQSDAGFNIIRMSLVRVNAALRPKSAWDRLPFLSWRSSRIRAGGEIPAAIPGTMRALRGGCGTGQEIAAFTSSATFFSTMGLHFLSAYDTGHTSPSSRFAASWKPRVE